jgi:hypothetical protein
MHRAFNDDRVAARHDITVAAAVGGTRKASAITPEVAGIALHRERKSDNTREM